MNRLVKLSFITMFSILFTLSFGWVHTNAEESQGTYKIENLNGSTLELTFKDAEVSINNDGDSTIKDNLTGKTEVLPSTGVDKNGNKVDLVYKKVDNGIQVQLINPNAIQAKSVGKCIAGTAGGAITGGGTLGLAGAAVGTVTIPGIGTVGAGAVGAITGAVGGGLTGAAAACFK